MMNYTVELSPEIYHFLQRQAAALNVTLQSVVESAVRLLYGNSVHIEQRQTAHGLQAYIRGTRVAVRHVIAFMKAGHSIDDIVATGLPDLPAAAIYEAVAYYHDHRTEIDAELEADSAEAGQMSLVSMTSIRPLSSSLSR